MRKILFILLAAAASLLAADATGTWSGTFTPDGGNGGGPALVILKQSGDSVTGTAGPDENQRFDITEGKVVGEKVTFQAANGPATMTFELTLKGDELAGNVNMERDGQKRTAKLDLKRAK